MMKKKKNSLKTGGKKVDGMGRNNKTKHLTSILFIEAAQLQNGVKFTKTAERYSFTTASV